MDIYRIQDRKLLAHYFRKDISLHFYSLGDLDDFYWPDTDYFGIKVKSGVDKVVLLYRGLSPPVFVALSQPGVFNQGYFDQLIPKVPDQVYGHLSPGLEDILSNWFSIADHGRHYKMGMKDFGKVRDVRVGHTNRLGTNHLNELQTLYQESYPGNAFDPKMLDTGMYFGYRRGGFLVSVAGVHVYSPTYRVAAVGNITTHPEFRNQGLARSVTARLCLELENKVKFIGLNVKADNESAVHLYQSLGFRISSKYGEYTLKKGS